jgi:hypothetical protein
VVAPVPPFANGRASPLYVRAKVPLVVTGEPPTLNIEGAVKPTLVTVPVPPPPLYCGMFKVLPNNVAAPLVPVVVNVILFCFAANLEVRFNKVVSASRKYGDNIVDVSEILTLLLKVFQSVEVRKPFTEVVACVIDKVLFAVKLPPPCNGGVVAIVIVLFAGVNPKAVCLLLNVVQSVEVKYPFLEVVALSNSMVGVVVLLSIEIGLPEVVAAFTVVTEPAPIALRKLAAVKAETLLSALNLGKVIAEGFVKVNIDCPMVVPPKLVRPVDATKSMLPPSHFSLSVNAVFQLAELFVIEDAQVEPVERAMPASG